MRKGRTWAIYLGLLVVLAGCDATGPSPRPSNGLPDITPAPLASAGRTPRPSFCVGSVTVATATAARIELGGPRGWQQGDLKVTTITRLLDRVELFRDDVDPGASTTDYVIGGQDLALAFEVDPGLPGGGLTDLTARYRAPGNSPWLPLTVEPLGSGRSITIPDAPGVSQVRLDATWTDGCFEYAGSARFEFEVVASAVAAACPSDEAGLTAIVAAHAEDRITIKDVARPIGTLAYSARYSLYDVGDQVGPFGSWDPAAPIVEAATGELLAVEDDDAELSLSGGFAKFYRLADPDATTPDNAMLVSETVLVVDGTGRLQVETPLEEGRYILELSASWELACLVGSGLAYVTVDVGRVVGSLARPSV